MTAINLERLQIVMPELEAAWTRKNDASVSYSDAVKNIAEQMSMEPGALKAYLNAKMRDKLDQARAPGRAVEPAAGDV